MACFALLMALGGLASPAWAQGPPYTFTKIQVPGAMKTEASGINNAGQVVGTYWSFDGTVHGYLFDGSTHATIDFPGAPYTFVFGINAAGQIVGSAAFTSLGPWFALVADHGTFTAYNFPNQQTDGRAINAAGQIVGVWDAGVPPDHGYLKSGDTYTGIDVPGAQQTYALGINNAGKISGTYVAANGLLHGFAQVGGQLVNIDFFGAAQTFVGGINNLDAMVGWSQTGAGTHGFLLTGNRFRAFDVDFPGVSATNPRALNDAGQVVGTYSTAQCPNACAFVATPRTDVLPPCDQTLALQYSGGTLRMGFSLRTSMPFTWSVSLFALNTHFPLWSVAIPTVSPAASFEVPFAFPQVGSVFGLSILKDAGGAVCSDFATVNTGP